MASTYVVGAELWNVLAPLGIPPVEAGVDASLPTPEGMSKKAFEDALVAILGRALLSDTITGSPAIMPVPAFIVFDRNFVGIIGDCMLCGYPVADYLCNDSLVEGVRQNRI